jgi:serine phosphatase RsbU (regulator of sigma subunit)
MFRQGIYIFFILLLLVAPRLTRAQEVNLDSLRQEIEAGGSDTASIRKLVFTAEKYRNMNLEAAMLCGLAAYEKIKTSTDKQLQVDVEFVLGIIYQDKSDFVNSALYLTNAEKKAEEINYQGGLLRCYNSLGNCYALQKQSSVAIGYYHKALDMCRVLKQDRKVGVILGNIGNLLYEKSEKDKSYLDSALAYYNRAYVGDVRLHDTDRVISMLNNMALVYGDKRDFKKARDYLAEARILSDKTGNYDAKLNYYNYMARVLGYEKNYAASDVYLDSCLALATQVGSINMAGEVYISKSDNAYEQGDYKKAYDYLVLYKHVSDSILNAENFAAATDIHNSYERERKQREIERLRLRNQNQKIIITSIVIFFVALVIFAIIIYRRLLENRRQKNIIEQQRNEMLDSIHYAKRIQTALLASDDFLREHLKEYFILYKPKDIVSGDFYWATVQEDKFIFCLGDCTGHGVPGAFMSLLNFSKLNESVNDKRIVRPDLVLNDIRHEIVKALNPGGSGEAKDGMDCTLCCFDFKKMELQYAAANNGLLLIRNGEVMHLNADRMPVGKSPNDTQEFTLNTLALLSGDMLYLFTDGYADQFGGPSGKKFKMKSLQAAIMAGLRWPMQTQKENLTRVFEEWRGHHEQVDDVAVVGIRIG